MRKRTHRRGIFILWGDHFDEVTAILFVAALRRAGWRTQLVGLRGSEHAGRHGLRLVADISLGEALRMSGAIACIILPCPPDQLFTSADPRVGELLAKGQRQNALFAAERQGNLLTDSAWPANALTLDFDLVELPAAIHHIIRRLDREVEASAGSG